MTSPPELFLDLASPYAYLAAERAERVLGVAPRFRFVLVGAIFLARGHGSWALTDRREAGVREIERRAAAYGLPPVNWPADWPSNSLQAMRAALWADEDFDRGLQFARAAYRHGFVNGESIADVAVLEAIAADAGLPAGELRDAIADPSRKARLKTATEEAYARGVRGVPTLLIGDEVFFGDDRLEEAATFLGA